VSASKRKGTAWESAVAQYLIERGAPNAERRSLNGAKDRGDIAGVLSVMIECKNEKTITLASYIDEVEVQRRNDHAAVAVAWIKRRGKGSPADGYVVMTGQQFIDLLIDADYMVARGER